MERMYSVAEVAETLRLSPYTVRQWIKDGKIKATRPGGKWLVNETDLREVVEERHG